MRPIGAGTAFLWGLGYIEDQRVVGDAKALEQEDPDLLGKCRCAARETLGKALKQQHHRLFRCCDGFGAYATTGLAVVG